MAIPTESTQKQKGNGTSFWMQKDGVTIDFADAGFDPMDNTSFDQLGEIVDVQAPEMQKSTSSEVFLDNDNDFEESSGGTINPGELTVTVAYKPGDPVQRRITEKFRARGESEKLWWKTVHPNSKVANFYFGLVVSVSAPTATAGEYMKRTYKIKLSGDQKLAEDFS